MSRTPTLVLITAAVLLLAGCASQRSEQLAYDLTRPKQVDCITQTGSHIKRRDGRCLPVPGRSYARNAVLGTGAMSTAGALAGLDPAVRIGN